MRLAILVTQSASAEVLALAEMWRRDRNKITVLNAALVRPADLRGFDKVYIATTPQDIERATALCDAAGVTFQTVSQGIHKPPVQPQAPTTTPQRYRVPHGKT